MMETKKLTTHPPARVMPAESGRGALGGNQINKFTTLTPFVKARQNAYVCRMKSVRSMPFAARKIDLLIGGKSNGVVCRDVMCHFAH
jgi:hypothetical protein